MKNIESFSIEEPKIDKNKYDNDDRYQVSYPNLKSPLLLGHNDKKKCPILFYVFIFTFLMLLILILILIIEIMTRKNYYIVNDNPYLKPNISNHNYTKIRFDNSLELLLIQVDENDTAGGSIIFDTGYLDTTYEPGFLKLAILFFISDTIQNSHQLIDYLGNFDYSVDEHYSYFSFKILNAGFFQYLEKFAELTFFEENDLRFNDTQNKINILNSKLASENRDLKRRENHLLEYLTYGYQFNNGTDIFPDGNQISNITIGEEEILKIKDVINSLLNPSKIKIVLNSHFKMSLMKTKFLKYFNNIINKVNREDEERKAYNISKFTTNKMIYMQIENFQTNYLIINYYINQRENNYRKLFINKGYLNYVKYILDETSPNSLYYNLTHSNNFNIKSFSCDFEVILKSKIKFSINIGLNSYSYEHLQDIILIIYQFMNDLREYIISLDNDNINDQRIFELYRIMSQNFSFTEDYHDITPFNPKKGIYLFCKNQSQYFLRDNWIPGNFSILELKEYISQLTPSNSVLIIGINNYTFHKYENYFNNSKISYIFRNTSIIDYYEITYTINDLDDIFDNITNIHNFNNMSYIKNKYISSYNGSSELEYNETDKNNYLDLTSEIIGEGNYSAFYFKKDTSFKIPKVYITLNFFHPFMRPDDTHMANDQRFFEVMLYMSYIKREIELTLSDAFRAGNSINMNFNQNLFYIDIFSYFDVTYTILENIRNILIDNSRFKWDNDKYLAIYWDAALEDYLNFETTNMNYKIRMTFYENLYNNKTKNEKGIYNYYNFPRNNYLDKKNMNISSYYMGLLTSFIINGYIYGYYNYTDAYKIYELFKDENKNFDDALISVGLNKFNLNSSNFVEWMKKKNNLEDSKQIEIDTCPKDIKIYHFIHCSSYNLENNIMSYIFTKILNQAIKENKEQLESFVFSQGEIYLQFNLKNASFNNSFKGKVIEIFKKNDYGREVDVVGNRLYYLIRSYIMDILSKREDLKNSAIARLNSNMHNMEEYSKLVEMKNNKIDDFLNYFEKVYNGEFYVNIKCNEA